MRRIVVLPDIHAPNEHRPSLNAVLKFIAYYKPTHLVQLGDLCDWDSVSSHSTRRERDIANIEKEIASANKVLNDIESACGWRCEKFLIGGNHEARYEAFKVKHGFEESIRRLKDFKSWHEEYRLGARNWGWCEYGETHEIGKLVFTHGWYSSGNHSARHLALFHKNVIYGHTHQFQVATSLGLDGKNVISASIGTLSRFDLPYLVGKPPINWMNMFAYIDMREDGTFTPNFVPIIGGKFFALGKEFIG